MKIIKHKDKKNLSLLSLINKKTTFIKGYWFDIINVNNERIGTITGYRLHIPLLLNDLVTDLYAVNELNHISPLCSRLGTYLRNNVELLKEKSGYLYFLNELQIEEKHRNPRIEKLCLSLLQKKMSVIVYSLGQSDFPVAHPHKQQVHKHLKEQESLLLKKNWIQEKTHNFFISPTVNEPKKVYDNFSVLMIEHSPFEHWMKVKGIEWAQSLWKGIVEQPKHIKHWKEIKTTYTSNEKDYASSFLDPLRFLKGFKISDFIECKPDIKELHNDGYEIDEVIRGEVMIVTFSGKDYSVYYLETIANEVKCIDLNVGVFNKKEQHFDFGGDLELFSYEINLLICDFFIEFFIRLYKQYNQEVNVPENMSLFRAALHNGFRVDITIKPL
ncbi:hypothetical protein [Priestia aryabhattai]